MSAVPEYQTLCYTCNKAPICTFWKDPKRSVFVLECEDFEPYSNPLMTNSFVNIPRLPAARFQTAAKERVSDEYIGLCKNCSKRATCTFPKPEGGVWECDEYE